MFHLVFFLFCRIPILFAIDEWNSRFTGKGLCQEVLDTFDDTKLVGFACVLHYRLMGLTDYNLYPQASGFWLYSISAAFDPIKGLRNADATTITILIPPYSED